MQPNRRGRGNRQLRGGSDYQNSSRTNPTPRVFNTATQSRSQQPHHHPDHPAYSSVPPHSAIRSGSGVSIVLKEDQPTGLQVKGIVADLLTRGDHPRGVKVRLRDGRVGRVQGLVGNEEGEKGEASAGMGLGRNGESPGMSRGGGRMVGGRVERDIREEDDYLYDESRVQASSDGLFAALEEADKRHQVQKRGVGSGMGDEEVVKCPVCGDFEGDERAVAFHVEEHFAG
ncbi:hypothetical protein CC86DRAFT_371335 [Ophiobolus disseminans]|uniref:UBZ4-type domain-containing protein n=1 Tax=Ophiobolus disseminans TaxID=1469910 RepID=A0A6A6ZVE9_9PLEO|nr:hypothetical protein CC86DRAFT_371335 [Ophiobolus disseminans]